MVCIQTEPVHTRSPLSIYIYAYNQDRLVTCILECFSTEISWTDIAYG